MRFELVNNCCFLATRTFLLILICFIIPQANKVWGGLLYRNHVFLSVHSLVHISQTQLPLNHSSDFDETL